MPKIRNRVKIGLGLIYSLYTTYFVAYKFILLDLYYVESNDWSGLTLILGWPIYILTSIPLIILFLFGIETPKRDVKIGYLIMISPTFIGILTLFIVTASLFYGAIYSSGIIFQPIYNLKISQIQNKLDIQPVKIIHQGSVYDTACGCARPAVTGSINISNNVGFPMILEIKPSYAQGGCTIDSNFSYPLKKGVESKTFSCFFNEFANMRVKNIADVTYAFTFKEKGNAKVQQTRTYSTAHFKEAVGF